MTGQQPVDHRRFDGLAEPLRQGRPQGGSDHDGPTAGLLQPRLEKGFLVRDRQQRTPSATPDGRGRGARRLGPAKRGLEVRDGGSAHTQGGGRLFEGGSE